MRVSTPQSQAAGLVKLGPAINHGFSPRPSDGGQKRPTDYSEDFDEEDLARLNLPNQAAGALGPEDSRADIPTELLASEISVAALQAASIKSAVGFAPLPGAARDGMQAQAGEAPLSQEPTLLGVGAEAPATEALQVGGLGLCGCCPRLVAIWHVAKDRSSDHSVWDIVG